MSDSKSAARERYEWELREIEEWTRSERAKCDGTPEIAARLAEVGKQLADLEAEESELSRKIYGLRTARNLLDQQRSEAAKDDFAAIDKAAKRRRLKALEAYEAASQRRPRRQEAADA